MHRSFNIDEHLTEQHWQPVFLFSKPSVSIHVCCSYIELSRSKLHKTGDLQAGNWHVNCQHSSLFIYLFIHSFIHLYLYIPFSSETPLEVRLLDGFWRIWWCATLETIGLLLVKPQSIWGHPCLNRTNSGHNSAWQANELLRVAEAI